MIATAALCRRTRFDGHGIGPARDTSAFGLIFPFDRTSPRAAVRPHPAATDRHRRQHGFGLGVVLGVLFVPCAGPVLAAIVDRRCHRLVSGCRNDHADLLAFAFGAALPLLVIRTRRKANLTERVQRISPTPARLSGSSRRHRDDPASLWRWCSTCPLCCSGRSPTTYRVAVQDSVASDDSKSPGKAEPESGNSVTDENRQLSNCTNGVPRAPETADPHRRSSWHHPDG